MAGYADLVAAKAELGLTGDDTQELARLAVFDDAISLRFDDLTGRSWGAYAPESRDVTGRGVSSLLILDVPLTDVTSVETDGTWNGSGWDDGTTVDPSYLRLVYGGRGLERTDGAYWTGVVRVTGAWGDKTDTEDPPVDVVAALTEAVVAEYRRRTFNARDTQRSFDEAEAAPPPRYENGPLWKAALATHALRRLVVA